MYFCNSTRSATSSAPTGSKIGSWKRGGTRVSNFDVRPPDGVELPPIGVSSTQIGVPNSYFSYANNPAVTGTPLPGTGHAGASKYGAAPYAQPKVLFSVLQTFLGVSRPYCLTVKLIILFLCMNALVQVDPNSAAMLTRHARRIYAGGIPPRATEIEIANFFNDVVTRALAPTRLDGPPVQKVYLNTEKCYAFVEFGTIELTTACMQLDGVKFEHYTGTTIVRVRRPNDYRPELLPPNLGPIPQLNLEVLGLTGASAPGGGPGKIFIGGLPYNLSDEQIMELLGAFGPIRSFHQVRDPGSITSKGYGFCEYVSPANAEAAIAGLNGMALGEKTLSVRVATQNAGGASAAASNPLLQQQMLLPGMGAMGHMGNMGMNMNMGMNPAMGMMGGGGYGAAAPSGLFGGAPPSRVSGQSLFCIFMLISGAVCWITQPVSVYVQHNKSPYRCNSTSFALIGFVFVSVCIFNIQVLRLSNMITRDDLYNETEYLDIREDVRLECQQYGKVHSVVIPRARDGFNPAAECLIFVEFETLEGSRAAANVLNGRKFADNTVVVAYVSLLSLTLLLCSRLCAVRYSVRIGVLERNNVCTYGRHSCLMHFLVFSPFTVQREGLCHATSDMKNHSGRNKQPILFMERTMMEFCRCKVYVH